MDSSREIRAMMMASFPCPPLPMDGSGRFINSHDMIAYLVDVAARRGDSKGDQHRQIIQRALVADFEKNIVGCTTEDETWHAMTNFTRSYMMSYHVSMHEARFLSFDCVSPALKAQVCSWLAAQHIIQGDDQVSGSFFQHLDPWPLYRRCKDINNNGGAMCASRSGDVVIDIHGDPDQLEQLEAPAAVEEPHGVSP
jgi:hypothetical protein